MVVMGFCVSSFCSSVAKIIDSHVLISCNIFVHCCLNPIDISLEVRKRSVIETINDEPKNVCQIEYIRHRIVDNFATNLLSELIVYDLLL